jgi:hypothetical protein
MHRRYNAGTMDRKKTGQIDRKKSDIDVMEHVIGGWSPYRIGYEPRGHASDHSRQRREGGQKSSHPRPRLRHK